MSTDSNNSELKAADGTPKDEADDRIAAVQAPTNPSAAIDGPKEEEAEEDAAIVAQEQPPSPREIGAEEDASIVAQERPSSPKESGADATFPEQLWDLVEAESRDGINNAEGQRAIEWTENGEGVSPTGREIPLSLAPIAVSYGILLPPAAPRSSCGTSRSWSTRSFPSISSTNASS